jgi:hypothetical protein
MEAAERGRPHDGKVFNDLAARTAPEAVRRCLVQTAVVLRSPRRFLNPRPL